VTPGTGCTVAGVILAVTGACAWSILTGHRAIIRARWAWRCRGRPPVREDGELLTFEEARVLGNLEADRDVRTRT
jgi:hypothetical protein